MDRFEKKSEGLLARVLLFIALGALVPCAGGCEQKDNLSEPAPVTAHEVKIVADAQGDEKRPAHVAVFLERGTLKIAGGAEHTVQGSAVGALGDPPPRVELMLDRVAVVQGAVGSGRVKGDALFNLALGGTPMTLEIQTGRGEVQTVDLGGVPVVAARLRTTEGHIALDWSSKGAAMTQPLDLVVDDGYFEATHVGRSGAAAVIARSKGSLIKIEVGELAVPHLAIDLTATGGKVIFVTPSAIPAIARVGTAPGEVIRSGWRDNGDGTSRAGEPTGAPRVELSLHATDVARIELLND